MNNEFRFERLSADNIGDLLPLYFDAFKENRPLEKIKAKFDTSAFGARNLAYIAYDSSNNIAAFYALFPVTIKFKGQIIRAAQVGDLMTHSKHRRKGLYINLANITHELARKEGIELIFTVPYGENASYQGFVNRLGFTLTHNLNGYYLKVNTLPLASLLLKSGVFLSTLHTSIVNKLVASAQRQKDFFANSPEIDYAGVTRDKVFFDYKKGYTPARIYEFGGVGIYLKIERGVIKVGDVEHVAAEQFKKAIGALKRFAFLAGIRLIQFETSPGTWLDDHLKHHTPITNYRICILNYSNVADNTYKFTFADLDNF